MPSPKELKEQGAQFHPLRNLLLGEPMISYRKPPKSKTTEKSKSDKKKEESMNQLLRLAIREGLHEEAKAVHDEELEKMKAQLRAELQAEAKAAEDAEKSKEAAKAQKLADAKKKHEEEREKKKAEKAERKAARQARRDAITYTVPQSKMVFDMKKDGKSWEEIANVLTNGANAKAVERHYNAVLENAALVAAANDKEKEEKEKAAKEAEAKEAEEAKAKEAEAKKDDGKSQPDGNEKEQTDADKIEVGKKAEASPKAKGDKVKLRGGDFTFSKKVDNKLKGMKKGNKSWKEIVDAIGNGVTLKDVKGRWKELNPDATDSDSESSKGNDKSGGSQSGDDGGILGIFGGGDEAEPAAEPKAASPKTASDKPSGDAPQLPKPGCTGMLKACDFFTEEECELLELLWFSSEEQKLLKMQAKFHQATGKYVPDWILERKLAQMA